MTAREVYNEHGTLTKAELQGYLRRVGYRPIAFRKVEDGELFIPTCADATALEVWKFNAREYNWYSGSPRLIVERIPV